MEWDWDPRKAASNLRRHNISCGEAATVFSDPLSTTVPDPDHSHNEDRSITIGLSHRGRLLIVAHTERGERLRIISARALTEQKERSRKKDAEQEMDDD